MALADFLSPLPLVPPFDLLAVHPAALLSGAETAFVEECGHAAPAAVHPAAITPLDPKLVKDGYGELILRVKEGGKFRPATKDEYAKAYQIFRKYAPGIEEGEPLPASRIEMMRKELRQINPNMVGTFIPRTLHDIIFLRKAIEEDIRLEATYSYIKQGLNMSPETNFWCTGVSSAGKIVHRKPHRHDPVVIRMTPDALANSFKLINIGHRLNEAASEILSRIEQRSDHLTLDQIETLVNEQITFLQDFYKKAAYVDGKPYFSERDARQVSVCFCKPKTYDDLTVDSEMTVQIIKNAIALECQPLSIGKIIAYRGTGPVRDHPVVADDDSDEPQATIAYSISYGSGLFPGAIHDKGACAFNFMRNRPKGYAFVITPSKENAKYFFTPRLTALESMFGKGELWHYRFKVSEKEDKFTGHIVFEPEYQALLKSPLSREELIKKFEELKKHHMMILKLEE